jgi:hypothetical protein
LPDQCWNVHFRNLFCISERLGWPLHKQCASVFSSRKRTRSLISSSMNFGQATFLQRTCWLFGNLVSSDICGWLLFCPFLGSSAYAVVVSLPVTQRCSSFWWLEVSCWKGQTLYLSSQHTSLRLPCTLKEVFPLFSHILGTKDRWHLFWF